MNKICSIVLPNQLFKESLFQKKNFKVFLVEENLFFNQYKFHKQKICFHRATMKFYYDYLNDFGCNTEYIDLSLIHISEPTRLLSISYAVFCLKKKKKNNNNNFNKEDIIIGPGIY